MGINVNNLYDVHGYVNMSEIIESGYTFVILVVGRGTGKTYGTLKHMVEKNHRFIYMRRTETQKQELSTTALNVFNTINDDMGWNIYPHKVSKSLYGYFESEKDDEGNYIPKGECLGLLGALSTMSSKRGMDGSRIDKMILDEFCPEDHERPLKNEANAILNCYETINRNRELQGRNPLQLIMLANSNSIASVTLLQFGLVKIITNMKKKGQQIYKDDKRSMLVICPTRTPIGVKKQDTALYRLIGENSAYSQMALNNDFVDTVFTRIGGQPLREYKPLVQIGDITIYKHKHIYRYYCSQHRSGTVPVYANTKEEIKKFRKNYIAIYGAYIEDRMYFEDEETQIKFIEILNK